MSNHSKVVWSEGMFLKSQHFQQQDRFVERLVRQRTEGITPFGWGLRSLALNRDLLGLGKLALDRCDGVFEDGTPVCVPEDDPHPAPLVPAPSPSPTASSISACPSFCGARPRWTWAFRSSPRPASGPRTRR